MSYLSSFIRLTWLSIGACPIFVAVTKREHRRTVLINANFWPHVKHYVRVVQQLLTVPFPSVPIRSGFYTFPPKFTVAENTVVDRGQTI